MTDIFVSYQRKTQTFVEKLKSALESDKKTVWVDLSDIPKGSKWLDEIYRGIEAAPAFVCVLTPDYVTSEICAREVAHALAHKKQIIPVVHELDPQHVPEVLQNLPWEVEANANWEALKALNWIFCRSDADFDEAIREIIAVSETDLEYERFSTRLTVRSQEWAQKGHNTSFVLRGADLRDAEQWLAQSTTKKRGASSAQIEYITASRQAQSQRQRMTIAAVTLALVVSLLLAAAALWQFGVARTEADNRATQQLLAVNNGNTATVAEGLAERNAATAQRRADETLGLLWTDNARAAQVRNDPSLALPLIWRASTQLGTPSILTQRILADIAYHPGIRWRIGSDPAKAIGPVAMGPNSRIVAADAKLTGAGTAVIRVLDSLTGQQIVTFAADGPVAKIIILPDGETCGVLTTVSFSLWEIRSGARLQVFPFPANTIPVATARTITLSKDGSLALLAVDNTAVLVELRTGQVRSTLQGHQDYVSAVAFSPDGQVAATGSFDKMIVLWDTKTGQMIRTIDPQGDQISDLVFSADGRSLWAGDDAGNIVQWIVADGTKGLAFQHNDRAVLGEHARTTLALSIDGAFVISVADDRLIGVWSIARGQKVYTLSAGSISISGLAEYGGRFLTISVVGETSVWDLTFGAITNKIPMEISHLVWAVAFSPDEKLILSGGTLGVDISEGARYGSYDGSDLRLWDATTGQLLFTLTGHSKAIVAVAFSPDGKIAASSSEDKTIRLWDVATGKQIALADGLPEVAASLTFSADGKRLYSGSRAGTVDTWDVTSATLLTSFSVQNPVVEIGLSRDGSLLAVATQNEVSVWNVSVTPYTRVNTFPAANGTPQSTAFSPDGKILAIRERNPDTFTAQITLWNVATKQAIRTLSGIGDTYSGGIRFALDGSAVISNSSTNSLAMWDVATGDIVKVFDTPLEGLGVFDVSRGGNRLVTGADPGGAVAAKGLTLWRIDSLKDLINWVKANREIRELTCEERRQSHVEPLC